MSSKRQNSPAKYKRNHWVPQAYLRPFAVKESSAKKIWAWGKNSGAPTLQSIKNVAVQSYLYAPKNEDGTRDYRFERKLASLEQLFGAPFWNQVTSAEVDLRTEDIRRGIALLMAVAYLRTPRALDLNNRLHAQLVQRMSDSFERPQDIRSVWIKEKEQSFDASDWEAYRSADTEAKKSMWISAIEKNATYVAKLFIEKRWSVVATETPLFITSDCPVMIENPTLHTFGIKSPGTIIWFPLSPTRLLLLDDLKGRDGQYYPTTDVSAFNSAAWHHSIRYVFSGRDPSEVSTEISTFEKEARI